MSLTMWNIYVTRVMVESIVQFDEKVNVADLAISDHQRKEDPIFF
jgi:hypothetical protein